MSVAITNTAVAVMSRLKLCLVASLNSFLMNEPGREVWKLLKNSMLTEVS